MKNFNLKASHLLGVLFLLTVKFSTAQNYTWIKGSNVEDQNGIYGTLGVPATANNPGGRSGATTWKDANGDFWLFGGYGYDNVGGYDYLNDLWKYHLSTNEWTWVSGSNISYQPGVYGTIGVPASTNKPGSRAGAVGWTDNSGNLWMFGGSGLDGSSTDGELNDLWKYSITTNQWTWVRGSNSAFATAVFGTQGVPASGNDPGGSALGNGWKDAAGNLWLFGGLNPNSGETFHDLWKYTISTNQWTWMKGAGLPDQNGTYGTVQVPATGNMPGSRFGSSSWADASGNLWLFGGMGWDATSLFGFDNLNDLWKYNISTNNWTWLKGSNTGLQPGTYGTLNVPAMANTPAAKYGSAAWMDAASGDAYVFGGNGNYTSSNVDDMNDLWRYSAATNQWTWLKGSNTAAQNGTYGTLGTPAPANNAGARSLQSSWIDNSNNLWLFGGSGIPASSSSWGDLNDLWKITNCAAPTVAIASTSPSLCAGSSATLTASGASTYNWSTLQTTFSISVSPSVTTSYFVAGTNATGCTGAVEFTVTVAPSPTVVITPNTTAICKGESTILSATGAGTYLWNTTPTSTNIAVTVSPTLTTTYSVTGTNASGCKNSSTLTLIVNTCAGIEDQLSSATSFVIYPNPGNGDFTIKSNQTRENGRILIFNMLGQKVIEQTLDNESTQIQSGLQKGVYIYQVIHENKNTGSGKLVVE